MSPLYLPHISPASPPHLAYISQVLQLPLPLPEEAMEAAAHATPRRRSERGTLARGRRWGELWHRRRRDLVKVCIECERTLTLTLTRLA